jgi:KUP system potassium uptake protein
VFLAQPFGTQKIAALYSPLTAIWFLLIGGCGIVNITYYPAIFRAIDPSRAVMRTYFYSHI